MRTEEEVRKVTLTVSITTSSITNETNIRYFAINQESARLVGLIESQLTLSVSLNLTMKLEGYLFLVHLMHLVVADWIVDQVWNHVVHQLAPHCVELVGVRRVELNIPLIVQSKQTSFETNRCPVVLADWRGKRWNEVDSPLRTRLYFIIIDQSQRDIVREASFKKSLIYFILEMKTRVSIHQPVTNQTTLFKRDELVSPWPGFDLTNLKELTLTATALDFKPFNEYVANTTTGIEAVLASNLARSLHAKLQVRLPSSGTWGRDKGEPNINFG